MIQQNKSECSNCGRDSDELGGVVCRECSGLDEVQEELDALKRQHEQLRAAVQNVCEYVTIPSDCEHALRAALDATPAEPVRETSGISSAWVLNQLAGMRFPEQGGAYDFMKRCLKASAESDEEPEPVRETFEAQAVRELLVRSEVAAEVLRTRAGFLEQACRALRDSEKKEKP